MPKIAFGSMTVDCPRGANLRRVLLGAGARLYDGPMRLVHCRGLGSCGTCAVRVEGAVTPPTRMERWRLAFPPHRRGLENGLRLACQCRVEGDLTVTKLSGWWGQGAATDGQPDSP